jgi:hypothetical protein
MVNSGEVDVESTYKIKMYQLGVITPITTTV